MLCCSKLPLNRIEPREQGIESNMALLALLIAWVSCSAAPAADAMMPAANEIALYLENARSRIHDVEMSIEGERLDKAGDPNLRNFRYKVFCKGQMTYTETIIGKDAATPFIQTTAAWNGRQYTLFHGPRDSKAAMLGYLMQAPRKTELDVFGNPIQACGLIEAPRFQNLPTASTDLAGILRNPQAAQIVPKREMVNGVLSLIVQIGPPKNALSYALDESRAFTVMRYQRVDSDTGKVLFRLDNSAHKEVLPGLWLPMEIRRAFYSDKNGELTQSEVFRVTLFELNKGIPDSKFSPQFPPGTFVMDKIEKFEYTSPKLTAIESIDSTHAVTATAIAAKENRTSEAATPQTDTPQTPTARALLDHSFLFALLIIAVVAALLLWRSRSHWR